MEHAIKAAFEQVALLQHRACVALDPWVGQQVSGGWEEVGNDQFGHGLAIELAFF